MGLISTLWVGWYILARNRGDLAERDFIGLVLTYLVACLFKENAVILPGLLLAAEITVVRDARPFRTRCRGDSAAGAGTHGHRPRLPYGAISRTQQPGGLVHGGGPAGALGGQRALTMLVVVPEWVRLLFWPAHLQSDYSPQEMNGATTWGVAQTLGLFLLAATVIAALAARRAAPVVTFGLMWASHCPRPGQQRAGADGDHPRGTNTLSPEHRRPACRRRDPASGVQGHSGGSPDDSSRFGSGVRLAAPRRYRGECPTVSARWANPFTQSAQLLVDAPLSYRSHYGAASLLWEGRQYEASEVEYRRAIALFPPPSRPRATWPTTSGSARCADAIPLYQHALRYAPDLNEVRASFIACLMYEGRYEDARSQARIGLALELAARIPPTSGTSGTPRSGRSSKTQRRALCASPCNRTPATRRRSALDDSLAAASLALLVIVVLRWRPAPRLLAPFQGVAATAPVLVAGASMVITWSAWGSLNPLPTVSDEAAYVLQARLLAHGRIVGDAAPLTGVLRAGARPGVTQARAQVSARVRARARAGRACRRHGACPVAADGHSGALLFVLCRRL